MATKHGLRMAVCGVLLAAVWLGPAAPAAAADDPLWLRKPFSGFAMSVATDREDHVLVAGAANTALPVPNTTDAFAAKYDATGRLLWKRQYAGPKSERANAIATDAAGSFYLTGTIIGRYAGPDQIWLAKYDGDGALQWSQQFGTNRPESAGAIATDSRGSVYIGGWTEGALAGVKRNRDAWIARYDANGNRQWIRQFGTWSFEQVTGLATDADGNLYISGYTGGAFAGPNAGQSDAWVAKYTAAGDPVWQKQFGTPWHDVAEDVAVDASGNVYLCGFTGGPLAGPRQGLRDVWVAKYTGTGALLWKRQFGTTADEQAYDVTTDAAGDVYLTGYTRGVLAGPGYGSFDVWVAKYDGAGTALWLRQFGTAFLDEAYGVAADGAGGVYVAGALGSATTSSALVAKLTAD